MHTQNSLRPSTKLSLETLEDRAVPATFGANQGLSLAVGHVINGTDPYQYVTGSGPGTQGIVKVFDSQGNLKYQVSPFPNYTGGINVAIGDVTGTVSNQTFVQSAAYAGGIVNVSTFSPHGYAVGDRVQLSGVNVRDATTGAVTFSYDGSFTVTAVTGLFSFQYRIGTLSTDPGAAQGGTVGQYLKDIIVSTTAGSVGRVKVYSFTGNQLRLLSTFQPYGPNFVGGIQITTGNVTGDFVKEIIVGQQTGGSVVKAYSVDPNSSGRNYFQVRALTAFPTTYKGGVTIASTNIDRFLSANSSYDEIIVGRATTSPVIKIFDVRTPTPVVRAAYLYNPGGVNPSVGVNVAAGNTDGLAGGEIYVSLKNSTTVKIFDGETGVPINTFKVAYPVTYGRNLDIAINDLNLDYLLQDLYVVASDGPRLQVPVIFPSVFNSPAGLNGSYAAP